MVIDQQDMFSEPEKKKHSPASVYLTQDEKEEIKEFSEQAGIAQHAFLQYAIRYFISAYKKDKRILKTKTETVLDMPG